MKLNILRLLVVVLACTSAVLVITRVRAQKSSPVIDEFAVSVSTLGIAAQTPSTSSTPQEKTVEQTRKNIKVLTELLHLSSRPKPTAEFAAFAFTATFTAPGKSRRVWT